MINESKEKVIDKVRKILALAEGGDIHEAEVAAKKATEILLRANLTMMEVDAHVDSKERDINHQQYPLGEYWKRSEGNWLVSLFHIVAEHNLCDIFYSPSYKSYDGYVPPKVTVIGTMGNIELVDFMSKQLAVRLRAIEPQEWSNYHGRGGYEKRGTYRRGFFAGAVMGIRENLASQKRTLTQTDPKMNMLMVMSDKLLAEYKKQFTLGKGRGGSLSSNAGYTSGRNVGKGMGIHTGVGGSNGTKFGGHLSN